MALGAAFGNALSDQSFLAEAIILDAYQRAYLVDLRDNIIAASNSIDLTAFLETTKTENVSVPMPAGLSFNFDIKRSDQNADVDMATIFSRFSEMRMDPNDNVEALRFSAQVGMQTRADLALRVSPLVQHGAQVINAETNGLFFNNESASAPQLTLLDRGSSLSLTNNFYANTSLVIGYHESKGNIYSTAGRGSLGQARIFHEFDHGVSMGFGAGYLVEEGALFRSTSSGAFGATKENQSHFVSISAAAPLGNGFQIFGSYTQLEAQPKFTRESFFSNWSRIHASAFTAGLAKKSVLSAGDRMGVTISQPLRVWHSKVDMTLPIGRSIDGEVIRDTQRVELVPDGRQTDIQWAYRKNLGGTAFVHSFAKLILQPGHNKNAKRVAALGVKWDMAF